MINVRLVSSVPHRLRERQRGSTAVEFSLVIPLLMTLLFGAIDGGRLAISRCMLSYSAIVGGRMASVTNTAAATDVQNAVVASAPFLGLSAGAVTVAITSGGAPKAFAARATGDTATVTVTYNYQAFLTVFSKFGSRTLSANSVVPVE